MTKDDLKTLATLPKLLSVLRKLSGEAMELQGLAATLGMMGQQQLPRVPMSREQALQRLEAMGPGFDLPPHVPSHGPPQPQPHINSEDTDPRAKPIPIQAATNISEKQAERLENQKMFLELKRAEKEAALARMKNGG